MVNKMSCYYDILTDDWDGVTFRPCRSDQTGRNDFYVYAHYNPQHPRFHPEIPGLEIPYYIGIGVNNRFCSSQRSRKHTSWMWRLGNEGFRSDEIGKVIINNLYYRDACMLESKLIVFWGCIDVDGPCFSGLEPCLFNKRYEPYPDHYQNGV